MRKYYYYHYQSKDSYGFGLCFDSSSCFPVSYVLSGLRDKYGDSCVITFWHEISCDEYEEMLPLINNNQK